MKIVKGLLIVMAVALYSACQNPVRSDAPAASKMDDVENNIDQNLRINAGRLSWQRPAFVLDQLGDVRDKIVADIGAGAGYFAFRLIYKGAQVIATDIDTDMINLMEIQKMNLPIELQSKLETRLTAEDDIGISEDEVDHVIIVNVVAYIDNQVEYLRKLKTAIKEGGKLLIVDYKMKRMDIDAPPQSERISLRAMEQIMLDAGYDIIKSDDQSLDYQYIILAE